MRRKFILIGLFFILSSFGIDDLIWNLPTDVLNGHVKSCRQELFFIEKTEKDSLKIGKIPILGYPKENFLKLYNKEGKIVTEIIFNVDSSILLKTEHLYENEFNERRTEIVDGIIKTTSLITYNQNSDITSYHLLDGKNKMFRISTYTYNAHDLIKEIVYSSDKSISNTYNYFYSLSQLDSIVEVNQKEQLIRKWRFEKKNNNLEIVETNPELDYSVVYRKSFYETGELNTITFLNINNTGEIGLEISYSYDKFGNLLSYNQPNDYYPSIQKVIYRNYDSNHNWTEKIVIENGESAYFFKRTIQYYD